MKNYIIFDLEWNQSPRGREDSVADFPFEIIEIGAVKLDENFQMVDEFHRLIRPQVYGQMHHMISEVTHMNMEELKARGMDFPEAARQFLCWCGEEPVYGTWGSMDLTELQRNMVYHGMEIPFASPLLFYDVQKLYSLTFSDGKTREALDEAVKLLNIRMDAPFHRALGDAVYTGKVMACLDMKAVGDYVSVDYYRIPRCPEEEIVLNFPDYSKFVSRGFASKEEAMKDKRVTDMVCYKCRRMLRKKIRWFSYGQRFYLCLAACPEHGLMKGKIRMKKAEDGSIFVVKTQKLVGEEGAEFVARKKEEARVRRAERLKTKKHGK